MENILNLAKNSTKKQRLIFLFIFILFLILIFGRFSLVNIKTDSALVIIKNSKDETVKTYDLDAGGSKLFFAKRGSYTVEFSKDNKQTITDLNLGYLNVKRIDETPKSQKNNTILGSSDRSCGKELSQNLVAYFDCQNTTSSIQTTANGQTLTDSFLTTESSNFEIVTPFMETLAMFAEGGEGFLGVNLLSSSPQASEETSFVVEKNPTYYLQKEIVATDLTNKNNSNAIFINKDKLIVFDILSKNTKKEIDLSKDINFTDDTRSRIALVGKTAYIVTGKAHGISEIHGELKTKSNDTKIITIDIEGNEKNQVKNLDKSLEYGDFSVDKNGNLVINAINSKTREQNLYLYADGDFKKITNSLGNNEVFCVNNSIVYYVKNGGVYSKKIESNVSELVYKIDEKDVSNLGCYFEELFLSLPSSSSLVTILKLEDDDFKQTNRPESFIPIQDDISLDIIKADIFRNTINLKLTDSDAYDNRNNPNYVQSATNKEAQVKKIINYLKENGIDVDKYTVVPVF